jgi:hypothetical protein
MNESGQGLGYLVLFTEIGFTLLVTTLIGVAAGYWLDGRIGTLPVLTILGFFVGAGLGSWAIYKLVSRFLATIE